MKKFFQEFKAFITRGNIVDLAVAVVVGGAFGKIVTSLVNDIIMPLISLMVGGVGVADWKWVIRPEEVVNGVTIAESALHYGAFLQSILDFIIIAFFVFLAIKLILSAQKGLTTLGANVKKFGAKEIKKLKNQGVSDEEIENMKQEAAAAPVKEAPVKPTTEELLAEIRDLLALQQKKEDEKKEE